MKIETIVKSHRGQIVKYANGIRISFDQSGVAEVSDADGLFLVNRYVDQLFPAGKVVQPATPLTPIINKADGSVVEELRDKLNRANRLVDDYKAQANSAKQGEAVWRTKCEELMGQITALKTGTKIQPPVKVKEVEKPTEQSLKERLEAKTTKELIAFAEELKLSKAEYQKLTKAKLVDYLINATTKNANS